MKYEIQSDSSKELFYSFWEIQRYFMKLVKKTADKYDLSVPEYTILVMMHHQKMTQKDVREKTYLPKSTLSHAIDKLVQSELLHREQVEGNRREIQLSISQKGREFIQKLHLERNGVHQSFYHAIESLTDKQMQELLHIHKQIITYVEKQGSDS